MRSERFGRRAACDRLQHRRLHFQKAALLEETPSLANDRDAFFEHLARMLVRDEIEITLAVPRFDVLQSVPFFRQRPQRFGQHLERAHFQCRLPAFGDKTCPFDADEIAEIEQPENSISSGPTSFACM